MNGIGRRRGASAGSKSPLTSIVVVVGSFMATFFVILLLISYVRFSSSAAPTIHGNGQFLDPDAPIVRSKLKAEMGDATDELTSKQFRKWAGVVSTSWRYFQCHICHLLLSGRMNAIMGIWSTTLLPILSHFFLRSFCPTLRYVLTCIWLILKHQVWLAVNTQTIKRAVESIKESQQPFAN